MSILFNNETSEMLLIEIKQFCFRIPKHYSAHSAGPTSDQVLTSSSTDRQVAAESHEATAADARGPTQ